MARKPIFVTLEESTHARMKSAAPLRGMNLQEAYEEALQGWLNKDAKKDSIKTENLQESTTPPATNVAYDTSQALEAARKGRELLKTLAGLLSEIEAVIQGESDGNVGMSGEKSFGVAAEQTKDKLRALAGSAEAVKRSIEDGGRPKQARHRKLPGGGA